MSGKSIIDSLNRIVGNKIQSDQVYEPENYSTRPTTVQTRGHNAPAADPNKLPGAAIKSPLTEVSRVEESFEVPAGTIYVPTQITMKDVNEVEFVFNFSLPTIE
jgi:hypothetical protein